MRSCLLPPLAHAPAVGNGQLTLGEQRAHFGLWALQKAPLLIGADLRNISADSLAILKVGGAAGLSARGGHATRPLSLLPCCRELAHCPYCLPCPHNLLQAREVIAINQDPLGVAGDMVWQQGSYRVCDGEGHGWRTWAGSEAGTEQSTGSRQACHLGSQSVAPMPQLPPHADLVPCRRLAPQIYAGPLAGGGRAVVMLNLHNICEPQWGSCCWRHVRSTVRGPAGGTKHLILQLRRSLAAVSLPADASFPILVALPNSPCTGGQYPLSNMTVHWRQLGLPAGTAATVRDLYAEKDLGVFTDSFTAEVRAGRLEGRERGHRPWDARHPACTPGTDVCLA